MTEDEFIKNLEQQDEKIQIIFGLMYLIGKEVPQDYEKAVQILTKVANQGNAEAQAILGKIYEDGEGVPKNSLKAMEMYKLAATKGTDLTQKTLEALLSEKSTETH